MQDQRHDGRLAAAQSLRLLALERISKSFGATQANRSLSFTIDRGEVAGIVGANGAGKSTLMRILAGVILPDAGEITFDGKPLNSANFSPSAARALGIRIVHQELSLCDSLTVAENFYLESPTRAGVSPFWRRLYARLARATIKGIFADSGVNPGASVGSLSIAQRQMVEIARAIADPTAKLIILDEPTSSLDTHRSAELRAFVSRRAAEGVSFIFVSHKLAEVKSIANRILIMRGGELVWQGAAVTIELGRMVELMAGNALTAALRQAREPPKDGKVLIEVAASEFVEGAALELRQGEIVGLAGLEGNGQRRFLHALREAAETSRGPVSCAGDMTFVSGDRVNEGVFPLWDVLRNASLTALMRKPALTLLKRDEEASLVAPWLERTRVDAGRLRSLAIELSGGNQQKVLMARALAANSEIILLDDPTRGVDVAVKQDFYSLLREAAKAGKLIIWLSSEDTEFLECDRVLIFHEGRIIREIAGQDISEDAIVSAAFERHMMADTRPRGDRGAERLDWLRFTPFFTAALVFGVIVLLNRNAASLFGIDLLLSAAVPLVLVAIAQMFVVGGSEIDLGVGAFAGLTNVLSATFLADSARVGLLAIVGALALYCLLGLVIRARRIPAIVVTLGASFVWLGIGYVIQPSPGGSSPEWLSGLASSSVFRIPVSVNVILLGMLAAYLINASRVGTMLRGFGANPRALELAGWSPVRAYLWRYGLSGIFTLLAGVTLTAVNSGSDINAGNSYTLLSIAAVVIGGCELSGGKIAPIGVVCGAITLSLIGSLLGFLNVSTDYNAAVQGGLLIGVLLLRRLPRASAR
jgi:ribose transport system ATP-binding protein